MSSLIKFIMPIIFVGVLGYFAYVLFIKAPVPAASALPAVSVGPGGIQNSLGNNSVNNSPKAEDIVMLTALLRNTKIDQTFFTSEIFLKLQDFSFELTDEPQGRSNPFSPIGVDSNFVVQREVSGTTTRR